MFDWMIQMAAGAAGLSPEALDKIEKALPSTKELIDLVNRSQPLIVTAQALAKQAQPLIAPATELWSKIEPLIPQVQRELADILPAASAILDVLHKHQQEGKSMAEASASIASAITAHHGGHG
jgi:uncharacterized protein YoxC